MTLMTEARDGRLADWPVYYGLPLTDVGDDGDVLVLGHHDERRVVAALNRHARTFWGLPNLFDGHGPDLYGDATGNLVQRWARLLDRCVSAGLEPNHTDDCDDCQRIARETAEGGWWITWSAKSTDPGAFPVTHWPAA